MSELLSVRRSGTTTTNNCFVLFLFCFIFAKNESAHTAVVEYNNKKNSTTQNAQILLTSKKLFLKRTQEVVVLVTY